jgi:Flp pilus assembly protein TadG
MRTAPRRDEQRRKGAATVEFAVLLPLLMFLFGIGVDFARAFYAHLIITNAARSGAYYGANDPTYAADTAGIKAAALKDTTDLGASVNVTSSTYTDASGNQYLKVNVTYPFQTVTPFPGVPSPLTINQTCTMRVEPTTPRPGTY